MLKKIVLFLWRAVLIVGVLTFIGLFMPRFIMGLYAAPRTFTVEDVPATRVAIVFGAGLLRDGSAGPVLSDRMQTAVNLYQAGKVDKILVSGDNRIQEYNEPEAGRQYALDHGIPKEDIVLDYAGRRTYDTCYRAKTIFGVDEAILITQGFHMPRVLTLCNWFGVQSVGVEADNRYFLKRSRAWWNIRETFAVFQAAWDMMITKPLPVMGEPEPIN
ncbi:MAG: YdcF family protein [Chloroflexi bacterium]|nr:YdcF family protein [Chloroflexota bacterium]